MVGIRPKQGATGTSGYDVWAVFNSLGSLTSRQLQGDGIDQHLAYVQSSNAYWYLTDHLGSTRAVIDNSGAVQDSLVYDAYGNTTYQTPTPSTTPLYAWDGYVYDAATGYCEDKARVYDPASGRGLPKTQWDSMRGIATCIDMSAIAQLRRRIRVG